MSPKLIVLDPDLQRLQQEGYEVEVQNGHVLVHSVPYVNAQRKVLRGIVVTNLNGNVGKLGKPGDHQVWFVGEYPCRHTGMPIEAIRHSSQAIQLWPGFEAQHRFSNKPFGANGYPDYYSKMKNYISIISNEAKKIDPDVTPCTFRVIVSTDGDSVFRYWDTASSRANIMTVSAKLAMDKIAIVGLGGTGSYVLDLVAKAPVREIHLYDGDKFIQHNAFRAPGAASIETLEDQPFKVTYFARIYGAMRTGIFPYEEYITESNISVLEGFDFVFLCVDKGEVRKLIGNFLRLNGIPFVDVGMELVIVSEENCLIGTCRATLSTLDKSDHFERHAPQGSDNGNDLYGTNIQVADMNALNAALAVIKWKQVCGFYQDIVKAHHTTYSINSHSLTRDEMTGKVDSIS
ncbi:MAG: ThiF family adenylyltransferase [Desulfobacterales bacterium]|jgi:molybdopterin/thiamine biosynthesis adenylyltransferase|nr:ThiF family adenylyltransferase [Desulfobacterales bacterium]